MKAKIKGKEFDPFTLEIRIETKRDLEELWCRFNVCVSYINLSRGTKINSIKEFEYKDISGRNVWDVLNSKLI